MPLHKSWEILILAAAEFDKIEAEAKQRTFFMEALRQRQFEHIPAKHRKNVYRAVANACIRNMPGQWKQEAVDYFIAQIGPLRLNNLIGPDFEVAACGICQVYHVIDLTATPDILEELRINCRPPTDTEIS